MVDLFWTNQNIYIENIYKPVVLGTLICFVAIAAVFAFGLYRHYQLLLMGGKENRFDQIPTRLKTALTEVFAQMRIIKEPYPGIMHLLIFWGTALFIIPVFAVFLLIEARKNRKKIGAFVAVVLFCAFPAFLFSSANFNIVSTAVF